MPLYARVLGPHWADLPEPLRHMHSLGPDAHASGLADVDRGRGLLARLIAAVVGFPSAGRDIPVIVRFRADAHGELWERRFAGRRFESYQSAAPAAATAGPAVLERFGPIVMLLRLEARADRLDIVPAGWRLLGLPLPRFLMPIGETYEAVDQQGRFTFHVEVGHPWLGLIVRYRGHLVPSA
jgi:hypothetical protein